MSPEPPPFSRIALDVQLGQGVRIAGFVNLYGCAIGDESFIGPFVEIQRDVVIGKRVKIQSHSFVCSGVTIGDEAFIGHGVMFINDRFPRATNADGTLKGPDDWVREATRVGYRASIGSNATILCGVSIGDNAIVGAGTSRVTSAPAHAIVAGNPARLIRTAAADA